ncbi:MAG: hypothetical protein ACYCOU_22675 [Sulfobacillus sp.]
MVVKLRRAHINRYPTGVRFFLESCGESQGRLITMTAIEEMQEAVIGLAGEIERSYEAGNTGIVRAAAQTCQSP